MPKIRVHQLAKDLELDSKKIIEEATRHGIRVKNHMSSLSDSDEMMLRAFLEDLRPKAPPPEPEPEFVVPPPEAVRAPLEEDEEEPVDAGTEAPAETSWEADTQPEVPDTGPREITVAIPGALRPVAAESVSTVADAPGILAGSEPLPDSEPDSVSEPLVASEPATPEVVPTATASPTDAKIVSRERVVQRRQAEILGRKEIAPKRPPAARAPVARSGRPASGTGGGGLIATRTEGGRRTFVNTGHGRGPGRGPGGPGRRPGPGGPATRKRRRRRTDMFDINRPHSAAMAIPTPDILTVALPLTLKGLSEKLGVKANFLIQKLFLNHKKMVKINDALDKETIELLGIEFDCDITCVEKEDIETKILQELEETISEAESQEARSPIVTFLGHVDHGKTSLLDAIRKSDVAAKEHGGITQHIGASRVALPDGRVVVFVDTPGHRAFTEMRARGAQVTDVVVLVVAADDGVMPQTKEAIAHAKAAEVPIVVALNKVDKHDANVMKVRQELAAEGLQDEAWGGTTMIKEVSAITGAGIDDLLEGLLLEAELLELKADPERAALATVLEAEQTRGEGNVARLLVTDGTLRKGDIFICGTAYGRIRAIKNYLGKIVEEAAPASPVQITGLNELPGAGDKLYVVDSLATAKEIADKRTHLMRERDIAKKRSHIGLENLLEKVKAGDTLKIILKVDVAGSKEVLTKEIMDLAHPEIKPEIIHAGVGGITETDVVFADASDAVILGFHVTAEMGSRRLAEEKHVEIRIYQVLYKLIDELKDAMEGKLAPEEKEVITGECEVRQVWRVTRLGIIAGCSVKQGIVKRDSRVRISRGGIVVHDNGSLDSLKRFKDDAKEVKEGFECGLVVKNYDKVEEGDTIIAYEIEKIRRTLD